jgi:hypothetical protein
MIRPRAVTIISGSERLRCTYSRSNLTGSAEDKMPGEPDPLYWRDSVKEARDKADQLKDPQSKRRMLGIAEGHERLAERIEQRLLRNEAQRRSSVERAPQ